MKVAEKEQTILSMQKQIEELRRKSEQGSQQLQGEVSELELENLLRTKFPIDLIEPVPKGEFGGDVLHRILNTRREPRTGVTDGFRNSVTTSALPRLTRRSLYRSLFRTTWNRSI